ncbi:MAG: lactate utilization protein B, partial [Bryobacteraceae bacterium]
MPDRYQDSIQTAVGDPRLQHAIYANTGRLVDSRKAVVSDDALPDYQRLRTAAHEIKKHTLDHLDHYLELAEKNITARGGKVVDARDAKEACEFVAKLAEDRGVKLLVKSKSMTTEEIELNHALEHRDIEAVETDLGEYILQLNDEKPYHIIAPALHKTRFDVAEIFERKLGGPKEIVPEKQTQIARRVLREKFLAAGIGVTGANFVVAESGAIVIVENEGNARLTSSAPKIHVAVAGLEKLIPRAQDLAVFLKLLARSATGQPLSVYTSFLAPPRRATEPDGPDEFYLLLLDIGRTRLLADEDKRESLYCIRCGACLNHCPVYRKIGGHSYPWVYSGPIGAIITPQYMGLKKDPWLPFASSLCGACAEVCPVKIDIPKHLLTLRDEVTRMKTSEGSNKLEKLAFRLWAYAMR